jgi:hypothetical protein
MSQCRFCKTQLTHEFIDLVNAPPSNDFLKRDQLNCEEVYWPLKLYVCDKCFLVQVEEHKSAREIFSSDYVYFSSFSRSWLAHCEKYVNAMISRFSLNKTSRVVELASNDGYLLKYFKDQSIPCLGIEPTASTAEVAKSKGIETLVRFFGKDCATDVIKSHGSANLIAANNVLAHVPDLNDFVGGIKILLAQNGVFTGEFPHLLQMVQQCQFDTIYHEHFSYFSFHTIIEIFKNQGLSVFDVEELSTHGGSLRIYADHGAQKTTAAVNALLQKEKEAGVTKMAFYKGFQAAADNVKHSFLRFLLQSKRDGKRVAGYGAAAKGNTLLNYCGVKKDLLDFVVDLSPHKQGRFLPGAHIEVVHEDILKKEKPDYVVILPWNLRSEITEQLKYIRSWDGKFVTAIPELEVF